MPILPAAMLALLEPFRCVFHQSTWNKVQVLVVGAILAPGKRTVTAVLRAVGLGDEPGFSKYHQVLNRTQDSCHRPLAGGQDRSYYQYLHFVQKQ